MSLHWTEAEWQDYQRQHGQAPPPVVSEKVFQAAVVRLAKQHGWEVFHPYSMKRSPGEGYPDLTLVHPERHVCIWAELKVPGGVVTLAQQHWLDVLAQVERVEAHCWRPEQWEDIARVLQP